jgi:hypothetical protein
MVTDKVRKTELAKRRSKHRMQIDRLLDLNHSSRIEEIEAALTALNPGPHTTRCESEDGVSDARELRPRAKEKLTLES